MPKLLPGDKAPDVSLQTIEGKDLKLSEQWQKGPVVLAFYRGDFCPVCNRYLHDVQQLYDQFEEAGVQVVAVSADRPEKGRETAQRHDLSFTVASDSQRQAVDAYDVVYNEKGGHAQPAIFVIKTDGTIAYESIVSGPLGRPSAEDVLKIARMAA